MVQQHDFDNDNFNGAHVDNDRRMKKKRKRLKFVLFYDIVERISYISSNESA
jgi:hypothetical protein